MSESKTTTTNCCPYCDMATCTCRKKSKTTLEEIYREALIKISRMKPSEIAPKECPGLVHGPQLLFSNCQRIADWALKGKRYA